MLQTGTVKKSTFGLLKRLQAEPLLAATRLVGGTALSLQIGHRESDDLDLFSVEPLEGMLTQSLLIDKYGFVPSMVSDNTLIGFVEGVKIGVIYHPFPWMEPAIEEDGIRIVLHRISALFFVLGMVALYKLKVSQLVNDLIYRTIKL